MSATPVAPLDLAAPAAPHDGLGRMATSLVGSEILRIAAEVRALHEQGRSVLNLTVGDFSARQFRIPAELESGIARALAAGQTNYPPADGVAELRHAVREFYRQTLALDYPLEAVLVAGGARPVIWAVYQAILEPGETVVYPVPSWNNNHYAHLTGARAVAVETRPENGFLPTAEELAPHLPGATLLALNSPLNPAGSGFRASALEAIARLVVAENRRRGPRAKPLYLLYDQIYWLVAAADAPHATPVALVPEVAPWTVFVDGISKAFAATGLRVGWAVAPPFLAARMRDLLGHVGAWAPKPEQIATAGVLADPPLALALAATVRDGINVRLAALDRALSALAAAGLPVAHLPPAGALYLSARFDLLARCGDNDGIRRYLLEEAGFAIVPFHAFGTRPDNAWFRLSVGAVGVDEIEAASAPLAEALRRAAS
ncbi:MAG: aspartate aminotransferase [Acidobacteria bacterium]|nr:aspartate aminotransferase [Acidobacteriota bacterium]